MSLMPLGYLSQGGGALPAAFELISTVYGSGSSSIITFSSVPSTYKHLQIRFVSNGNATNATNPLLRFNSDSATTYSSHLIDFDGSGIYPSGAANQSSINVGRVSNSTYSTSAGASIIDILEYGNTNIYKTVRFFGGHASGGEKYARYGSGNWRSTSAISTITITNQDGANWPTSGRFSLYGVKGA